MSDYDNDILIQIQRDGIRTMSGHHIRDHAPASGIIYWACGRCMDQGCDYCNDDNPERCPECDGPMVDGVHESPFAACLYDPDYDGGEDGEGNRDWQHDR